MKITEINMKNVKGQTRNQQLTGREIIIGRNGSGKTTRIQSIGLAMMGYVPGHEKTNQEIMKLASDEKMSVGLKTETGFEFSRTYTREEKENPKTHLTETTVSQHIYVEPTKGEKRITEKEKRIADEIGNFPCMLDFNEFLSLSDAKRRDFFYNMSPIKGSSWTKERISQKLDELLTLDLKVNNPDKYATMVNVINETMAKFPEGYDIQAGLLCMITHAKDRLSQYMEKKRDAKGAVRELTDIKNDIEITDRGIANNKAELKTLQDKLIELSTQIAGDEQKQKAMEKRNQDIETLKQEIVNTEAEENPDKVEELKAQLEEKRKETRELPDYIGQRIESETFVTGCKERIDSENKNLLVENTRLAKLQAELDLCLRNKKIIDEHGNGCFIDAEIICPKDFTKYIDHVDKRMGEINSCIEESRKLIQAYESTVKEYQDLITSEEGKIKQSHADEQADISHNNQVNQGITSLEFKIEKAKNWSTDRDKRLAEKREKLATLEAEPAETIIDIEVARKQKEGLQSQITQLGTKIEGQQKSKITLSNLQTSLIDSKSSSWYADCYKAISDALGAKGIQGEMVKSILDPIRASIQDKFEKLSIPYEFFFHTETAAGKEIFQFGWRTEAGERNFDALSQGEQLLLLIALLTEILERNSPPHKGLYIDNIENLDNVNFDLVVNGLNAIGEKLDNIILSGVVNLKKEQCDASYDGWKYKGFRVINLSEDWYESGSSEFDTEE